MKNIFFAVIVSAVALAAVSTPAAAQPGRQCLRVNQIDSFSSIRGDQRSMVVIDRFRNKYKIGFNAICDDIDYNGAVQIRTLARSGLACVSRGDQVISRGITGWRDRCVITSVQPYTPAMERADVMRNRYRR